MEILVVEFNMSHNNANIKPLEWANVWKHLSILTSNEKSNTTITI